MERYSGIKGREKHCNYTIVSKIKFKKSKNKNISK